tara:strand:+ start:838 stop:1059 length:222 start_codon:yes stop_codon:yes gene_type:complete
MSKVYGVLIGLSVLVTTQVPLFAGEVEPLPDTMCDEVMTELLIAVHEGYIDSEVAEEVGGRCYKRYGGMNTNK